MNQIQGSRDQAHCQDLKRFWLFLNLREQKMRKPPLEAMPWMRMDSENETQVCDKLISTSEGLFNVDSLQCYDWWSEDLVWQGTLPKVYQVLPSSYWNTSLWISKFHAKKIGTIILILENFKSQSWLIYEGSATRVLRNGSKNSEFSSRFALTKQS